MFTIEALTRKLLDQADANARLLRNAGALVAATPLVMLMRADAVPASLAPAQRTCPAWR